MKAFIVTVTGMRDWTNKQQIWDVLDALLREHFERHDFHAVMPSKTEFESNLRLAFVVRHGKSGSVDTAANEWARENKVTCERFQAEWHPIGGGIDYSAGPRRNRAMAAAQPRADLGLAFWDGSMRKKNNREYSGTLDCMKALLGEGIPLRVEPPRRGT